MVKIIDIGIGNCGSINNMLSYLQKSSEIANKPQNIQNAKAIILPGVGSYDHGVNLLKPFKDVLEKKVLGEGVPFLGICLGMQLLLQNSEEGSLGGLGWIKGEVHRFKFSSISNHPHFPLPHMGWNEVRVLNQSKIFQSVEQKPQRFYFAHSFHAVQVPKKNEIATCTYGYNFTCAIQDNNIFGVQFHPEKSHKFGKQFFKNFMEIAKC
jgi:glutamine amidotransferase